MGARGKYGARRIRGRGPEYHGSPSAEQVHFLVPTGILRPLKAIPAKCFDCCCNQYKEIRDCPITDCSLWPYRMGKRPREPREDGNPSSRAGRFLTGLGCRRPEWFRASVEASGHVAALLHDTHIYTGPTRGVMSSLRVNAIANGARQPDRSTCRPAGRDRQR